MPSNQPAPDLAAFFTLPDHPVVEGVHVLVPQNNYAGNFGKQWKKFSTTQIDSFNGTTISRDFIENSLNLKLDSLAGKTVLELGAGAGRFTEHLSQHAAVVVAADLSEAIFANTSKGKPNVLAVQGNILSLPTPHHGFDLVFCRGVIQHTPRPPQTIQHLHRYARVGGEVTFDVYGPSKLGNWQPKYIWRKFLPRWMTWDQCSAFLEKHGEKLLKMRWKLKPYFRGKTSHLLDLILPLWDYQGVLPLNQAQLVEWARLDTLDAMYAHYDQPMTGEQILNVLKQVPCEVVYSDTCFNAYRTRLREPIDLQPVSAKA